MNQNYIKFRLWWATYPNANMTKGVIAGSVIGLVAFLLCKLLLKT